jgi:signal transduction histidine kinase
MEIYRERRKIHVDQSLSSRAASKRLSDRKEDIIEAYVRNTRKELGVAKKMDRDDLVDSLPLFIDNLVHALEMGEDVANVKQSLEIGSEHGRARAEQSGFSLNEVLVEYRILSQVIFEKLREQGQLDLQTENSINDATHRGIANAATVFTQVRSGYEKKQHEKQDRLFKKLRASQKLLKTVIAQLPVGVSIAEAPSGKALFKNEETERLLGHAISDRSSYREYERYGAVHADGTPYRAEEYPTVRALLYGKKIREENMIYRRPDGTESLLVVNSTPIRDAKGDIEVVVTTFYDVTNLRRVEQRAQESIEELKRERDLREQFVSALSHDLRSPLTAAKVSAELIARAANSGGWTKKLSERILDTLKRMDHMIQDLLDANSIRAGKALPLNISECDLKELITSVLDELKIVHRSRFFLSEISTDGDREDIKGYWDYRGITRVLENLCSNAIKYGSPKTPVKVSYGAKGDYVFISVHNEGKPIPLEEQKTLFSPFYQGKSIHSSEPRARGWGLGLTLVRGIVEGHDGEVRFESGDQGTTFTVQLPKDARSRADQKKAS